MFKQNNKFSGETDFCFALTAALFNLLLLGVLAGTVRVLHFLLTRTDWLNAILME